MAIAGESQPACGQLHVPSRRKCLASRLVIVKLGYLEA